MSLLLHAADVSNPAKPLYIQEQWAASVLAEFFAQGDLERALGLPVSPGLDRLVTSLAASQMNFSEFVVLQLFNAIVSIFPVRLRAWGYLGASAWAQKRKEHSARIRNRMGEPFPFWSSLDAFF
jgi:hypothetical protein